MCTSSLTTISDEREYFFFTKIMQSTAFAELGERKAMKLGFSFYRDITRNIRKGALNLNKTISYRSLERGLTQKSSIQGGRARPC
jgi:hypothetical protein